jgi:hypothetical protein
MVPVAGIFVKIDTTRARGIPPVSRRSERSFGNRIGDVTLIDLEETAPPSR